MKLSRSSKLKKNLRKESLTYLNVTHNKVTKIKIIGQNHSFSHLL